MRHLILLGALAIMSVSAQERLGSIAGMVSGNGRGVSGVTVSYVSLPPVNLLARKTTSVTSGVNGAFTLTGMAAGSYMVCIQAPVAAGVLDPCVWSPAPLIVTLLSGQNLTGQTIQLQKAATLQISVVDPKGLIAANEGKTPGGHLVFGTWVSNHLFLRASITSQTTTTRAYQMVVPQGSTLNISMETGLYQVQDATGAAISPGVIQNNFPVPTAATTSTLTFQVVGVSAH